MLSTVLLLFGCLAVLMLIGTPIGIALGASTALVMYFTTTIDMTTIPSACFD